MADLGFLPVVRRLLDMTPPDGQRMLFSATLDKDVDVLVRRFMTDPAEHSVGPAEAPGRDHPPSAHRRTGRPGRRGGRTHQRQRPLTGLHPDQARRASARPSADRAGIPAGELHGDLTQSARDRNLAAFAAGSVRVMVATDIAARGIHVDGIDLVVHADSPTEPKAYLHRSGGPPGPVPAGWSSPCRPRPRPVRCVP